jgi:hypothetical protein
MVQEVARRHDHDPMITLTALSDRIVDSTVPILYDSANRAESMRAWKCYISLLNGGRELGFIPYRYPADLRSAIDRESGGSTHLAERLKEAVDPRGIIAPRQT